MAVQAVDTTPVLARQMLGVSGVRLRPERKYMTKRLIALAESGELISDLPTLRFVGSLANGTAELIDGQSVLQAIIASNTTLRCAVIDELPEEARYFTNSGSTERFSDWLIKERKQSYACSQSSVTTLLYLSETGSPGSRSTGGGSYLGAETLGPFYDDHPGIAEMTIWAQNWVNGFTNYAAVAVAKYQLDQVDAEASARFFADWAMYVRTKAGLEVGHPLVALHSYLEYSYSERPRLRRERVLASIYRCWNAWRSEIDLPVKMQRRGWGAAWLTTEAFPVPI